MRTLYKFLEPGLVSRHGDCAWKIGEWQHVDGPLVLCSVGFHASAEPLDALHFVCGQILARVEVRGIHVRDGAKEAWSEMRIVGAWQWTTRDSVDLAIYAAEQVIGVFESRFPLDKRPREAIAAARHWAEFDTDSGLRAASNAANDAATWAYTADANAGAAASVAGAAAAAAVEAATWSANRVVSSKVAAWASLAADAASYPANDASYAAAFAPDAAACSASAAAYSPGAAAGAATHDTLASESGVVDVRAKINSWMKKRMSLLEPYTRAVY